MFNKISFPLATTIIIALSTAVGAYSWYTANSIQSMVAADSFLPKLENSTIAEKFFRIYTSSKYSDGKPTLCLEDYLKTLVEGKLYYIEKACPIIAKDIDFTDYHFNKNGTDEVLVIHELINNPKPLEKYFTYNSFASTTDDYMKLYSEYVLAQSIKDKFYTDNEYRIKILNRESFRIEQE